MSRLGAHVARFRSALVARGQRHVAWFRGGAVADLGGGPSDRWAPVLVVGREHYSESVRRYPAIPWRELRRVLHQEIAGEPGVFALPGPLGDERVEVRFFRLRSEAISAAATHLWVVPETVALAAAVDDAFLEVDRCGFRYFLAPDGASQPEGGMLRDARLQALAMGVPPEKTPCLVHDEVVLGGLLWSGLWRLPAGQWAMLGNPGQLARWTAALRWRPLAATAVGGLLVYMTLASVYLGTTLNAREQALAELGGDVSELLALRDSLSDGTTQLSAIVELENARQPSYRAWAMVAAVWDVGGSVAALQISDGRVALRGTASNAADVIDALSRLPAVAAVRMDAPVRRTRGGESFAVVAELTDPAAVSASRLDEADQ